MPLENFEAFEGWEAWESWEGWEGFEGGEGAESEGSESDEALDGDSEANWISGLGGADTIQGGAGEDSLWGDDGDDVVAGGEAQDLIEGGGGHDSLSGGEGHDAIRGNAGADTLAGGDGDDLLVGDEGNDSLQGDDGDDLLSGGNGADTLDGGTGDDRIDLAEGGADLVNATGGLADLDGDTIAGFDGDDRIRIGSTPLSLVAASTGATSTVLTLGDGSSTATLTLEGDYRSGAFRVSGGAITFASGPTLVSSNPADNATGVAIDSNLVLTFSEEVQAADTTAGIEIRDWVSGASVRTVYLTDSSQVTVNGSTVTIDLASDLDESGHYYLSMASGALTGESGSFAGLTGSTTLDFTTADSTAPTLVSSQDGATGVAESATLTLTFSEAVQAGTGILYLRHQDSGAVAGSFSVTDTSQVTVSGSTLVIDPAADLASSTHYYVEMAPGVIQDTAGNSFAGLSGSTALDFTTGDTVAPTSPSFSPADGSDAVEADGALVLTFSETVRPGSGSIHIRRYDTGAVAVSIAVTDSGQASFNGSTLTVDPTVSLDFATHYYLEIAEGVIEDGAGNPFAGLSGSTSYDFTTGAAPPPPPPPPQSPPVSPPASPPPVTQTVDGVTVQQQTTTNSDGSTTRTTTIPVVTGTRQEQTGNNSVADIPLVTSGSTTLLAAQVPTGVGLTVSGGTTAKTAGTSVTDLIREIEARTTAGSADRTDLTGGGTGFLGALPGDTPLIVQTLVPTVAGGSTAAPTEPLVISAPPPAAGQAQTALVIDTRNLPSGTIVQLQNVSFAAVIGAVQVTGGDGSQSVFGDGFAQYIVLGADDDTLHGGDGADTVGSRTGDDVIYGDGGDDNVFGGDDADRVFGGVGADTVQGNKGADFVQGNQGDDTVWAGQGNDTARGGRDADQVHGDLGDDVVYGDYGSDQVYGNAGNDTLWGGDGNDIALDTADTLFGGQGNDIVYAQYGADSVSGDLGDDYVEGNRANDSLSGGDGADTLRGGRDDDLLQGGAGNDALWGDLGDDTLTGGAGADVFVFRSGDGADTVTDFSLGDGDRIRLASGMTWTVAAGSGGAVVSLSGGGTVTLSGVAAGDVTAAWFVA